MKKIIIVFLALLIPISAIADPICGIWPMFIEKGKTLPTIWNALGYKCESILTMIDFRENGEVFIYDVLFSDGIGVQESELLGSWEKENDQYTIRMIGSERTLSAYMDKEDLLIALYDPELYFRLSRFESFDWYNNVTRAN